MRRPAHLRPLRVLITWGLLFALLLVASTPLWHHHDGPAPHTDCTVCLAGALDKSDGLPPPRFVSVVPELIEIRITPPQRAACLAPTRRPTSRGPPAL